MTGIVGFTFSGSTASAETRLLAMLDAVKDHPSYHVDHWVGDGIALGRVSLGRLDKQPQPIWNEDRTRCIVFEGELSGASPLRSRLEAGGHQFTVGNSAELLLHLWEEEGEKGLLALNGGFTFAIWNTVDRSLVLGNDRFGFRSVFYASGSEEGRPYCAFACGVRGLLADKLLPRQVDLVGMSQALHFEYVMADRTYIKGCKMLLPASVLCAADGRSTLHRYWRWRMPEVYPLRSREYYLGRMLELIEQAMARQLPAEGQRAGVNLSGGLDSRMLIGALGKQTDAHNLHTYTFGQEDCDDVRLAAQVAHAMGTQHQSLPLPPDYLLQYASTGVRLTDGMDSCIHIHSVANIDQQAREVDFLYTGFYVDSITNPAGTREWLVHVDDDTALRQHYEYMHRLFPQERDEDIYTPEFIKATREEFDASFRETVMEYKGSTMFTWVEGVEVTQRQRRLIQCGNDLLRWQVECRTPFTDTDFVDFCMALPPAHRLERYLFTQVFTRSLPKLAKIPNDRTGMPFIVDAQYLSKQVQHNLRYWLHQHGLGQRPQHQRKLYADYRQWFRTVLRPWVEETLLDNKTQQRGILQPAALQRIVHEHMTGAVDRTREIGMLLSNELWHRAYLD